MLIIGYIKVKGKYTPIKCYSYNEFKNRKAKAQKNNSKRKRQVKVKNVKAK